MQVPELIEGLDLVYKIQKSDDDDVDDDDNDDLNRVSPLLDGLQVPKSRVRRGKKTDKGE